MPDNFLNKSNWDKILRGYIFEAVIFYPSDTKRPLLFFIPEEGNKNKGSLVTKIGNFEPNEKDGKKFAIEQQVVVGLKPRRVLLLSNDDLNKSTEFEYVQVAPIMTISPKDKIKSWYLKTKQDEHPVFVYLADSITGKECYIDISEIMSIHKTTLLERKEKLPDERMLVVEDNILECLALGLIESEEQEEIS